MFQETALRKGQDGCTQTKPHQQSAHKWLLIIYRLYLLRQIDPSLPGCGAGSTSSHSALSKGAHHANRGNGEEGNLLISPHKGQVQEKQRSIYSPPKSLPARWSLRALWWGTAQGCVKAPQSWDKTPAGRNQGIVPSATKTKPHCVRCR